MEVNIMNDMNGKKDQEKVVKRDENGFLIEDGFIRLEMKESAIKDFAEKYLLTEDPEEKHPSTEAKLINGYDEIKRLNEMLIPESTKSTEFPTESTDQQIMQTEISKEKAETGKKKKAKKKTKKKEKACFFKYDGGSTCLVFKGQKRFYNTEAAAEEFIAKEKLKVYEIKFSNALSKHYEFEFISKEVKTAFYDIMFSTQPNNDWRSILISLFTSYMSHRITELGLCPCSDLCKRAPIFQITIGSSFCERMWIERLSSLLPKPESKLDQTTPVIFPSDYNKKDELDNAYMEVKGIKIPAQYHYSAVIVDTRILKKYNDFVFRNKWANILLITDKNNMLRFEGIIKLDIDTKGFSFNENEMNAISIFMCKFDYWMRNRYKDNAYTNEVIEIWNRNEHIIRDYGIESGHIFWQTLRLMVADIFAEFIREEIYEDESPETIAKTKYNASLLKNCFLPGCCQLQIDGIPLEKRPFYNEKDYPEIFKRVMREMLGDLERLPHIPRGEEVELCPKYRDEEETFQYYGYRRWTMKNRYQLGEPVIYFVRDEFLECFQQFNKFPCESKAILEYCEANTEYFPKRKIQKDHIPRELGDNPVASVMLLINKLDFLDEDKRPELLKPLGGEKQKRELAKLQKCKKQTEAKDNQILSNQTEG